MLICSTVLEQDIVRTLAEHMAKLPNLPEVLRARHPLASVEDSDYESNGDGSVHHSKLNR